ncbi:tyrosine-type recombinase/integrase [Sphingobium lactosutens]|uniref:Tyr recombinase domain-containing protein n=1 Tax=Sphingobium lactosutens DS20 TaxID=1331060 RepID=T0IPX9_9SPHN|nr:tyrosine-type recombinase/integrase [Sphingobium lactosutens]EQB11709.1 hypothetical protein RLDS_21500 [Sphingobium lactosutens DS20]
MTGKNVLVSKSFRDGGIYLFLRGDYKKPIWMCRIKAPGQTGFIYRSTRTTDEHQAYRFADDLYHQQLVKAYSGETEKGTKVAVGINAYIDRFEPEIGQLSIRYRILLLKRVLPHVGKLTFEGLTTASISKLTDDLRKGTKKGIMSPNTTKRVHNDLRHFFRWCVEEGYLKDLPKFPRINGEKSRRPHFNETEWRKITRQLREFVKVTNGKTLRERTMLVNYVLILANTGIRVGEARTLKWRDVREVAGPNDNRDIILTVNGKTGIREVVARTADVKIYFRRILELRSEEQGGKAPDPDSLVFCHKDGSAIGSFKKSFQTLLEKCGVQKDSFGRSRTIYSLRHTYATFRLHEGVNHFALARNMGTSVQMLEEYYGHTSNITMSQELTKGRGKASDKTDKPTKTKSPPDNGLGWLRTDHRSADRKTVLTQAPTDIAGQEPSYLDLL